MEKVVSLEKNSEIDKLIGKLTMIKRQKTQIKNIKQKNR